MGKGREQDAQYNCVVVKRGLGIPPWISPHFLLLTLLWARELLEPDAWGMP